MAGVFITNFYLKGCNSYDRGVCFFSVILYCNKKGYVYCKKEIDYSYLNKKNDRIIDKRDFLKESF